MDQLKVDPKEVKDMAQKLSAKRADLVNRFFKYWPKLRGVAIFGATIIWLSVIGASVYLCWFYLMPMVSRWGFEPLTWRAILSVLAMIFLAFGPLMTLSGWGLIANLMSGYVEAQESDDRKKLRDLSSRQESAEDKLIGNDQTGLIPLIQYSRLQLESYYTIGLSQTRRSFRYCIIAMSIGFLVIVGGIGLYLFPFLGVEERASLGDIQIVVIAGGVVIEIISALFLWIYRNSINQLNYFYNRQMHLHNVLVCERIAASMNEPDETRRTIVEKVLSSTWDVKPPSESGKGITKLITDIKS